MALYPFPVSPLELLGLGSGPMFVAEQRGRAYYRAWPTGDLHSDLRRDQEGKDLRASLGPLGENSCPIHEMPG